MTERIVPPGRDLVDDLTVAELDTAARKLRFDVVEEFATNAQGRRWLSLAWLVFLWAKRANPDATLEEFTAKTPSELSALAGMDDDEDTDEEAPAETPTPPASG